MTEKIILVTHDPADTDDRASAWLAAQGYELERTCPAEGGMIPPLTEETAGVVVYGGKYDVDQQDRYPFLLDELRLIEEVLKREVPFLGFCLGGQLLAHALGEEVGPHPQGFVEYGYYDFLPTSEGRAILGEVPKVLQSHFHGWYNAPKGVVSLGRSETFPEQAFRYGERTYGFQFHPEASRAMLERWIARRPPERHLMPGAHPPERQRADFERYDKALGEWLYWFLARWAKPAALWREAAE
jgi:GMP synthase (glutamine-hydrolysing)